MSNHSETEKPVKSLECEKCDADLHRIKGLFTDRDGWREDAFCPECNTRYGVRAHGLELISEAVDMSALATENRELKITIRRMMEVRDNPEQ